MHEGLNSFAETMDTLLADEFYANIEFQNIRSLQKRHQEWKIYIKQRKAWEVKYKQRIEVYDSECEKLQGFSELWSETHINATNKRAPEAVNGHIVDVIIEIEEMRNKAKKYL